jgi:hypothetical protein
MRLHNQHEPNPVSLATMTNQERVVEEEQRNKENKEKLWI